MNAAESIERGDTWWVELDLTQGHEIQKTRPCLVLTSNVLNRLRKTVVVIPLSSSAKVNPPITVAITSFQSPSVAILDQVKAVGKHRFRSLLAKAKPKDIEAVETALKRILDLK